MKAAWTRRAGGPNRPCDHLELRGSVQPALVLAQLLPVLGLPDDFVDGLQDPSAAGLSSLQQGEVWSTSCREEKKVFTHKSLHVSPL